MSATTHGNETHRERTTPRKGQGKGERRDEGESPIGRGHEREPLKHYLALMATFTSVSTAALAGLRAAGRPFPARVPPSDLLLLGLATSRLSRLLTRDKVTRVVRAPFTEVEPGASPDEVKERPRPVGDPRRAIGELLLCPRCVAVWAAMALGCGYVLSPPVTRLVAGVLASAAISDFVNAKFADLRQAAEAKAT
ncbi:MAG TPA: DUF1360 domain-containing protein [Polyangiaceae bacterium]|nr:DUF1360 domain-containing protein [Polyangiaceae bacterium]